VALQRAAERCGLAAAAAAAAAARNDDDDDDDYAMCVLCSLARLTCVNYP